MMQRTPDSYYAPRNRHKQGIMKWQGEKIKVDEGIQPLLLVLNRFPGIATVSSCVGPKGERGFVVFRGDDPATVKSLVIQLAVSLDFDVCFDYYRFADTGIAQGSLRWIPADFDAIVKAIEAMHKIPPKD